MFGTVGEGLDVLDKINEAYCDKDGRPYIDIRIKHTRMVAWLGLGMRERGGGHRANVGDCVRRPKRLLILRSSVIIHLLFSFFPRSSSAQ